MSLSPVEKASKVEVHGREKRSVSPAPTSPSYADRKSPVMGKIRDHQKMLETMDQLWFLWIPAAGEGWEGRLGKTPPSLGKHGRVPVLEFS